MRALDLVILQDGDPTATPPIPSFKDVVAQLSGVPCDWGTQSQQMHQGPYTLANALGSSSIVDEVLDERVEPTAPDGPLPNGGVQQVSYGIRERTIQITALSIDQRLDKSARAVLERIEDKLAFQSTSDLFDLLGLALLSWSPITILDPKAFDHVSSAAAFDLIFRFGKRTADTAVPRIVRTTVRGVVDERVDSPVTAILERP